MTERILTPRSRTAFIAWLLSFDAVDDYELQSYIAFNSDTGLYMEPQVQRAWAAWQAAEAQPGPTTSASSETAPTEREWAYLSTDSTIYSSNFEHDAALRLTGDFADDHQKTRYGDMLAAKLSAPSARNTILDECATALYERVESLVTMCDRAGYTREGSDLAQRVTATRDAIDIVRRLKSASIDGEAA